MKSAMSITLMLFISVIASSSALASGYSFFSYKPLLSVSTPTIINAELYPPKVKEGDVLLITAKLNDVAGIISAEAEIDTEIGIDRVKLHLTEGNIQSGIWKGDWIAHSTKNQKWYNLSITASNVFGRQVTLDTRYFDPVQNHSAAEVTAGTFDTGDYVFPDNLTVTGNVNWNASNMNPTNLLSNGDFESWSAGTSADPDGWTLGGSGISQDSGKRNTYSCKLAANSFLEQSAYVVAGSTYIRSRTYTFSCWVNTSVANKVKLRLADGASSDTESLGHSGSGKWELITVTKTASASATALVVYVNYGNNEGDAYFDGCTLVEGSTPFAFSDKPAAEGVWSDYFASSTIVGWAASPTGSIYTKKIGKTVFVQYRIFGTSNSATTTFTVPYTASNTANLVFFGYANAAGTEAVAYSAITKNTNTVTLYKDAAAGAFATSGTKNVEGQFWYEAAS